MTKEEAGIRKEKHLLNVEAISEIFQKCGRKLRKACVQAENQTEELSNASCPG
jgi:hypothetical protein